MLAHDLFDALIGGQLIRVPAPVDSELELPQALGDEMVARQRDMARRLGSAFKFDFGDHLALITQDRALAASARDLCQQDQFYLPFDEVYFEGRWPCVAVTVAVLAWSDSPKAAYQWRVFERTARDPCLPPPCIHGQTSWSTDFSDYSLAHSGEVERFNRLPYKTTDGAAINRNAHVAERFLLNGTLALASRGVEVEIIRAPLKLNQARAAKKRLPLFEHRVVKIQPRPGPIAGAPNGSHASPRIHWRRGHTRRLGSDRLVRVRPHLVGCADRGVVSHDYAWHDR